MSLSLVRRLADANAGGELSAQRDLLLSKNNLINSNFDYWQRGLSFSSFNNAYTADRWIMQADGTVSGTVSRQAFTLGQTAVPNNPRYFHRTAITSASGATVLNLMQRIENVDTLAGKTVTLSFWAKADASRTVTCDAEQVFGTGGSPSSTVTMSLLASFSLTTSWQQFYTTFTFPSVSGKTLGTGGNDYCDIDLDFPINTVCTIDIAQIMLNEGSTIGPYMMAGNNLGHELSLCQRYYEKSYFVDVPPASNPTLAGTHAFTTHSTVASPTSTVYFRTAKRANITATAYNPYTGIAGQFQDEASNVYTAALSEGSNACFRIWPSSPTVNSGMQLHVHWTADAEL